MGPRAGVDECVKIRSLDSIPGPSATATLSRDRKINENATSNIGTVYTDPNVILRRVSATIVEEEKESVSHILNVCL